MEGNWLQVNIDHHHLNAAHTYVISLIDQILSAFGKIDPKVFQAVFIIRLYKIDTNNPLSLPYFLSTLPVWGVTAQAEKPKPDEEEPVEDGCQKPNKTAKGAQEDMKIDKSKLTPEELAALEAIEKKAGIQDDPAPEGNPSPTAKPTATPTQKFAEPSAPAAPATDDGEDIYKGLHPAVKAELERLRKQADAVEERELQDVAKKYEIIGKKADELVPTLKSLKAAGGDAYDQMIAVLDASVAAVEKSGLFSEFGKRGASGESDAWAAIEKHAETIQKSAPTMSWAQAVDKACEQHPELVHDYENGR